MSTWRSKLCVMCLSDDRHLYSLEECRSVLNLCYPLFASVHLNLSEDYICWECKAHLARIASFKTRVLKAQEILSALIHDEQKIVLVEKLTNLTNSDPEILFISSEGTGNSVVHKENKDDIKVKLENLKKGNDDDNGDDDDDDEMFEIKVEVDHESNCCGNNDERSENSDNDALNDNIVVSDFTTEKNEVDSSENKTVAKKKQNFNLEDESEDLSTVCVVKNVAKERLMRYRDKKRNVRKFKEATHICMDCIKVFESEAESEFHATRHTALYGDYSCPICRLRFTQQELLEKHETAHYTMYQCTLCRFECGEKQEFRRHCDRNHQPRRCDQCNMMFSTVTQARLHRMRTHKKKPTCQVCSKQFYNGTNLRRHMLTHEDMPLMECELCHKQCRGETALEWHRRTHIPEPKEEAYCVECGVQFKTKHLYKAHLKHNSRHVTSKEHKCPHCERCFSMPTHLRDHINSVHTKNILHYCQECGKGFYIKRALRTHILKVHEGKEPPRNKQCNVCGKAFTTKMSLQQHMNTHTGARPYVCAVCPATFAYSGALHTHTRLLHNKLRRSANTAS